MSRAGHLRQSSRKVFNRAKPNRLQEEILRMFRAEKLEFRLSDSLLWSKIQIEMEASKTE